ncbi:HSP20-like chaperone [Lactifluus volemus]|nr:HSP20-like chaperone [Lactifluus volemus]
MSQSKHPEILWAQRSSETAKEKNVLFVTINLPDIVESSLQYDLQPASLSIKAQAGYATPSTYEFNIDLYKEVIPEECGKRLTSRSLVLTLRKKDLESEYWPRLTKEKIRNTYIKTDFSKWVDEDEQEGAKVNFDDEMDFGGGMPGGMPGMPGGMPGGLGGMPGMPGGFGGADYDLDKMMASMGGPGDDHAGEHDTPVALDDPESDDSDDAEPPPLESPASAA